MRRWAKQMHESAHMAERSGDDAHMVRGGSAGPGGAGGAARLRGRLHVLRPGRDDGRHRPPPALLAFDGLPPARPRPFRGRRAHRTGRTRWGGRSRNALRDRARRASARRARARGHDRDPPSSAGGGGGRRACRGVGGRPGAGRRIRGRRARHRRGLGYDDERGGGGAAEPSDPGTDDRSAQRRIRPWGRARSDSPYRPSSTGPTPDGRCGWSTRSSASCR